MRLDQIAELAREYRNMGDSVTEQLHEFMDDDGASLNANAVRMFQRWTKDVHHAAQRSHDEELVEDCEDLLDRIDHYLQ